MSERVTSKNWSLSKGPGPSASRFLNDLRRLKPKVPFFYSLQYSTCCCTGYGDVSEYVREPSSTPAPDPPSQEEPNGLPKNDVTAAPVLAPVQPLPSPSEDQLDEEAFHNDYPPSAEHNPDELEVGIQLDERTAEGNVRRRKKKRKLRGSRAGSHAKASSSGGNPRLRRSERAVHWRPEQGVQPGGSTGVYTSDDTGKGHTGPVVIWSLTVYFSWRSSSCC